jgi:hypothetical protein
MKKFTVEFSDLKIKSIHETDGEMPTSGRIPEEHTGEIMYTTVHAENEASARFKAERLADHLRDQRRY